MLCRPADTLLDFFELLVEKVALGAQLGQHRGRLEARPQSVAGLLPTGLQGLLLVQ